MLNCVILELNSPVDTPTCTSLTNIYRSIFYEIVVLKWCSYVRLKSVVKIVPCIFTKFNRKETFLTGTSLPICKNNNDCKVVQLCIAWELSIDISIKLHVAQVVFMNGNLVPGQIRVHLWQDGYKCIVWRKKTFACKRVQPVNENSTNWNKNIQQNIKQKFEHISIFITLDVLRFLCTESNYKT